MTSVILKEGENLDSAIRRLKRSIEKAGLPKELRLRERFEKPSKQRQRKAAAAKKRLQKKIQREQNYWKIKKNEKHTKKK